MRLNGFVRREDCEADVSHKSLEAHECKETTQMRTLEKDRSIDSNAGGQWLERLISAGQREWISDVDLGEPRIVNK